jgi:hypothetical protein
MKKIIIAAALLAIVSLSGCAYVGDVQNDINHNSEADYQQCRGEGYSGAECIAKKQQAQQEADNVRVQQEKDAAAAEFAAEAEAKRRAALTPAQRKREDQQKAREEAARDKAAREAEAVRLANGPDFKGMFGENPRMRDRAATDNQDSMMRRMLDGYAAHGMYDVSSICNSYANTYQSLYWATTVTGSHFGLSPDEFQYKAHQAAQEAGQIAYDYCARQAEMRHLAER